MVLVSLYLSSEGLKKENVRPCTETLSTMERKAVEKNAILSFAKRGSGIQFHNNILLVEYFSLSTTT